MAATRHNKLAGQWLRSARESGRRKRSGAQFAKALSEALETTVNTGALYAWEAGTRTVPAAVLVAAAQITKRPIAFDEQTKKDFVDEIFEEMVQRFRDRGLDL
jgi:hypothetical protein